MATTPSYTELVAQIADYANNDSSELAAATDDIILAAVNRIEVELPIRDGQVEATGTLTIGDTIVSKPANAERNVTMWAKVVVDGATVFLQKKNPVYIMEMYPTDAYRAAPKFYADLSPTEWLIGPATDGAYAYTFRYRTPLVVPDGSNETPFVVKAHWEVLVAAVLAEVGRYNLDPEMEAKWESAYAGRRGAAEARYWMTYGRDETRVPVAAVDNQP